MHTSDLEGRQLIVPSKNPAECGIEIVTWAFWKGDSKSGRCPSIFEVIVMNERVRGSLTLLKFCFQHRPRARIWCRWTHS